MLQALKIIPVGKMMVCDGCARAKATQKRTNKVTTVVAEKHGERIYMDTSGPYSETVKGSRFFGINLLMTKQGSHGIFMEQERMA